MDRQTLVAFADEVEKISGFRSLATRFLKGVTNKAAPLEVAGLAMLAAPSVDNMIARRRARSAGFGRHGHVPEAKIEKFRKIKEKHHDAIETVGLGILAAPYIAQKIRTGRWEH